MIKIDTRSGFNIVHTIKVVLLLEKPIGRNRLMNLLKLNEASTRTLIKRLKKNGLIKSSTKGCLLTKKGRSLHNFLRKNISGPYEIEKSNITISEHNIAYVVKGKTSKINKGLEQRDEAIKLGAEGLTTLVYDKILHVPGVSRNAPKNLIMQLNLRKNDVVLIGSAKERITADLAALYSAYLLLRQ